MTKCSVIATCSYGCTRLKQAVKALDLTKCCAALERVKAMQELVEVQALTALEHVEVVKA